MARGFVIDVEECRERLRKKSIGYGRLTDRQADILTFILRCWLSGYVPTMREIGEEFGIRTPNGVQGNLMAIKRKGYLDHVLGKGYYPNDTALKLLAP